MIKFRKSGKRSPQYANLFKNVYFDRTLEEIIGFDCQEVELASIDSKECEIHINQEFYTDEGVRGVPRCTLLPDGCYGPTISFRVVEVANYDKPCILILYERKYDVGADYNCEHKNIDSYGLIVLPIDFWAALDSVLRTKQFDDYECEQTRIAARIFLSENGII